MSKPAEDSIDEMTWTTWEELLLTCAVKRHGQDWDSVAMELQNRSSQPLGLTAQICMDKYKDLKRRFMDEKDDDDRGGAPVADDGDTIPWLEELKKLRMAELKQEVHRRDLSIQSLQLKVKQLEEERERDSIANENDDKKPDLENDKKNERSDNDKSDGDEAPAVELPENITSKSVSGEYSDRDSRTLNVSNSTENVEKSGGAAEPVPDRTDDVKQDPENKPVAEDSCNDSSDTVAKHAASKRSQEKKTEDDSNEFRNSAAESKERTSDVQSSASLTKKIRRRVEVTGTGSGGGNGKDCTPATIKRESAKTEPLVEFLDIFRKHGSMFERRLDIQKTDDYKNTIRQHVDLETIQTRIDDGSYSSCPTKFYSDLLLLFNNAVVFFPKDSDESAAAVQLRNLVLKEIKKKRIGRQPNSSPESAQVQLKPDPEKPDSLLAKHKPSVSIVVCRKRSSISAKPGSSKKPEDKPLTKPVNKPEQKSGSGSKQPVKSTSNSPNEEESLMKLKGKEKPVTGVRSMRRSSNSNRTSNTTSNKGNSNTIAAGKVEAAPAPAKVEKKKAEAAAPAKKSGAADFLKRIKRNSPAKGSTEEGGSKKEPQKKKVEEKKEVPPAKKKGGGGGGSGKQVKEESSPSKRMVGRPKRGGEVIPAKRGREVDGGGGGGGGEDDKGGSNSKRPKKRTRR